jgi:glycerophosphoryl diester phosphodiesterase
MNNFFSLLCLMLLTVCCSPKEDGHESFFMEIDSEQQTQNFGTEAEYKSITVISNCAIEASSNQDWCTAVILNYSTDNLRISVVANSSMETRTAQISVSSKDVKDVISITVHQTGIVPAISVNRTGVTLRNGTLDFALDVTANVPVVFDKPEWIAEKAGNTWTSGNKTYAFTATPLPADVPLREGNIVVRMAESFAETPSVPVRVIQQIGTRIIAHRGYWDKPGASQNSLASLRNAIETDAYGSELDVWITTDNVIVLNHDATYGGVNIEQSAYSAIEPLRLSNGESLPTLQQCIDIAKQQTHANKTKLIIEIKTHSTNANNKRCVDAVVKAVTDSQASDLVDYIAFSSYVCEELIKNNCPRVAYLNGNLTPTELKSAGYWGLDYNMSVLTSNPAWINQAKETGLTTNVWTVNTIADMQYFVSMGVDFITTDQPQLLKNLLSE